MLNLLTRLAHLRRWTRTRYGWEASGLSPALLLSDGWRHLSLLGGYVRVGSEAAALGWTVFAPSLGAVGRWARFSLVVGLAAIRGRA